MMSVTMLVEASTDSDDTTAPTVAEIRAFAARLSAIRTVDSAAAGIDTITALEELTCVAAAGQSAATAGVDYEIQRERRERGRRQSRWDLGIAKQIGLARRESHHRGSTYLGLARALTTEMPHTLASMRAGRLSEFRATVLVREIACLTAEDRREVDRRMCADPAVLDGVGTKAMTAIAAAHAAELDAGAVVRRKAKAARQRRVSVKPAPEFMGYLTALLPMDRAVCAWATLRRDAQSLVGTGAEGRTVDQVMADLLVERVTGIGSATAVPVQVQVVISDVALFGGGEEAAFVPGYGPVAAAVVREWIADAAARSGGTDEDAEVTLRRLYACPESGKLTALESRARAFPAGLARFIDIRDRTCRTPWCDAPIRHHDHVERHADGGSTSGENGQGLCEACNLAKEADGWSARVGRDPGDRHTVITRTPTGHTYASRAAALPRPGTGGDRR